MNKLLIPNEESPKTKRKIKKQTLQERLKIKIGTKVLSGDKNLLKASCLKIMEYLSDEGKFTVSDINILTRGLERSIMVLQKQKTRILEKELYKIKKKDKKK